MASTLSSVSGGREPVNMGTADSDGYKPSPDEPFMNEKQLAYFKAKLLNWKEAIHR